MPKFYKLDDIKLIDLTALVKMLPGGGDWNPFSTRGRYISAILRSYSILDKYGINTPLRIAHFLGQGLIETGFLRYASENLNYSASALRRVFPKYVKTEEQAKELHRKPEQIANVVYGGRMGNTEPGDGWKYRGRGFFQLTGRNNYRHFGEIAGIDLENNPEVLEKDLTVSVQVAAAYFAHMKLGNYADQNNARAVSRGINLGNPKSSKHAHGEDDRIIWTNRTLELLNAPTNVLKTPEAEETGAEAPSLSPGDMGVGARGAAVKELQEKLAQLGYSVGTPDGIFGQKTRRAVVNFQQEHGLETSGQVDEATMAAIDEALEGERGGNVDIYREARTNSEVRRETGTGDGTGTGGAVAGATGAAGVAYETGVAEEVYEAGKEVLENLNQTATEAGTDTTATGDETGTDETSITTDETITDETVPDVTETTTETQVSDPPSSVETATSDINWPVILFVVLALLGIYILLRARARSRQQMDDYRYGR